MRGTALAQTCEGLTHLHFPGTRTPVQLTAEPRVAIVHYSRALHGVSGSGIHGHFGFAVLLLRFHQLLEQYPHLFVG
jgi:creatinine amidohydrolase/Fe(II)-dependent formamide hydrolase-like protein